MELRSIAAFGTTLLCFGTALAGPAEELAAFLDGEGPGLDYASVEATGDGGVVVRGLTATAAFLLGLPDPDADRGDPAASPVALTIESLRLSEGVTALLLGTSSGAEQGPLAIAIDGYSVDLTTMSGAREVDLLRGYLATDRIEGAIVISVAESAPERQAARFDIRLDPIAHLQMQLEIDVPGVELPSGAITLIDTPDHGFLAAGAYLQRLALEAALDWAALSADAPDPEAPDPDAIALLRAELADLPGNGPEAAADLAEWATGMAAALPEHADLLQAVAAFATGPGTLHITFSPPDPDAELIYDMSQGPDLGPRPEQVAATIETLGLTVEFAAAE